MKQCKRCGKNYFETPEFFQKHRGCRGGLLPCCKHCISIQRIARYASLSPSEQKVRKIWHQAYYRKNRAQIMAKRAKKIFLCKGCQQLSKPTRLHQLFCSRRCMGEFYRRQPGKSYAKIILHKKAYRAHRILMEHYLGRKLAPHEIIHHRNECKRDNGIENLQIVTRKEHGHLHHHSHYHYGNEWKKRHPYPVRSDENCNRYKGTT